MVYFVGAGPGDPDLITVKGQRLIEQADTIVYAGSLVNPDVLQGARFNAKIYDSSKMSLPEIISAMKRTEPGITVRLHTGDPSIYGAIREQMEELDKAGISYRVIPGVSSFSAAAATLHQEYTVPDGNQTLIITREEGRTPVPAEQNLASLAGHGAAMAIFLSAGMPEKVQEHLLEGGYTEDTPAALVYRASWPDEKVVNCTVGTLAKSAAENGIQKQAMILVGDFLSAEGKRSKLYDPAFSTDVRAGEKEGIAIAAFTDRGEALAHRLAPGLSTILDDDSSVTSGGRHYVLEYSEDGDLPSHLADVESGEDAAMPSEAVTITRLGKGKGAVSLADWTKENWYTRKALIFIGAAGIAVRAIAPYVKKKTLDPAVLVLDEDGHYIIPVLSGHVGGGVKLAQEIEALSEGKAIITTASDVRGVFAVDTWAAEQGLIIQNSERIVDVTSALLSEKTVTMRTDVPVGGPAPEGILFRSCHVPTEQTVSVGMENPEDKANAAGRQRQRELSGNAGAYDRDANFHRSETEILLTPYEVDPGDGLLLLLPVAIGIGMKRGTGAGRIEAALKLFLQDRHINSAAVKNLYTIDLKKDEAGLLFFAKEAGVSLTFFSAEELSAAAGEFTPSAFVKEVTGVDNVCERAAVLGAGAGSTLLVKKSVYDGITFAAAVPHLAFPS